jgi:hypothetical protein
MNKARQVAEYFWERLYPQVFALVLTAASLWLKQAQKLTIAAELASPVLSVFSIIVGFVAAVVTFLLTAQEFPVLAKLKTTRAFDRLIGYHWSAIFWGFLASLASLVLLAAYKLVDVEVQYRSMLFHVWMYVSVVSVGAFFRVFSLLKYLLQPLPAER